MRNSGICSKCSHNRLVHVAAVADATHPHSSSVEEMHLAVFFLGDGLFGEKRTSAGRLSAVVCRRCGFTELYVVDPEALQPDGRYITEMTGPDQTGPFR